MIFCRTTLRPRTTPRASASRFQRYLSSTSNASGEPSESNMATVVQGPSLVQGTGIFRPSPSLMMLPGLRSLPFWTSLQDNVNRIAYQDPLVSHVVQYLEKNAPAIRQEYIEKHPTATSDYDVASKGNEHADDALHKGSWDWHSYMQKGKLQAAFPNAFPVTAQILDALRQEQLLFEHTPFGFCFLSTLHPQSSIQAHTAPMNFRLRLHLPLIVPNEIDNTTTHGLSCGIRVGPAVQPWTEGRAMVLDDSYEHEVWNHTDETRVLLLVDIWHPDLHKDERERIAAMFEHAQEQGWLGKNKK